MMHAESLWPGFSLVGCQSATLNGGLASFDEAQPREATASLVATSPHLDNTFSMLGLGDGFNFRTLYHPKHKQYVDSLSLGQPFQVMTEPVYSMNSGTMTSHQSQPQTSIQNLAVSGPLTSSITQPSSTSTTGVASPYQFLQLPSTRYPAVSHQVASHNSQGTMANTGFPTYGFRMYNGPAGTTPAPGSPFTVAQQTGSKELMHASTITAALVVSPRSVDTPIIVFFLFSDLPAELRAKIWKLNLPNGRVIEIKQKRIQRRWIEEQGKGKRQVFYDKDTRFVSNSVAPINLAICKEAREEALRSYVASFPTNRSPGQIYVNFKIDTIIFDNTNYFPRGKNSKSILTYEFSQIRYLMINYGSGDKMSKPAIFKALTNLEELSIAIDSRSGIQRVKDPLQVAPYYPVPSCTYSDTLPKLKAKLQQTYDSSSNDKENRKKIAISYAEILVDQVAKYMIEGKAPTDVMFGLTLAEAADMGLTYHGVWTSLPQPVFHSCG